MGTGRDRKSWKKKGEKEKMENKESPPHATFWEKAERQRGMDEGRSKRNMRSLQRVMCSRKGKRGRDGRTTEGEESEVLPD